MVALNDKSFVSLWVGNFRSPAQLTAELTKLYSYGLPDDQPEPEVVFEGELVEIETLLEPISGSDDFLAEALAKAKEIGIFHATASVGVFSDSDRWAGRAQSSGSTLVYLGTFRFKGAEKFGT
jgi:hypothetical protein